MMKSFNFLLVAGVIAAGALFTSARADDAAATTKPAATQVAPLACCGDDCKSMGKCCTADDKAKVTCSMGGSCCKKADEKKPDEKKTDDKGMGGMDMGK